MSYNRLKPIKQTAAILFIVLLFAGFDIAVYNTFTKKYINSTSAEMQARSIEVSRFLPFDENSEIIKYDSQTKLDGDLPIIDGAAALFPVFSAFVNSFYPGDSVIYSGGDFSPESALQYTNTRGAYKAVADGTADIVFCADASEEQLAYAESRNVTLEFVPIGYEAFVFIVNKNNPVDDISADDVRKIFSGKIKNWSEVGGENKMIEPVTRNIGSGSQTSMLKFMNGAEIKHNPLGFTGSAIGYSFRYYVTDAVNNGGVKMLSLNGVYPDKEHIADGSYPVIGTFYAVYDKNNENENIGKFIDLILSDEGQDIIEKSGYVPLN